MRVSILAILALLLGTNAQALAQTNVWNLIGLLDASADARRNALATEVLIFTLSGDIDWGWEIPDPESKRLAEVEDVGEPGWTGTKKVKVREDLEDALGQILGQIEDCAYNDIVLSILHHEFVHVYQDIAPGVPVNQWECEAYSEQASYLCFALFDQDCYGQVGQASETVCRFLHKMLGSASQQYNCEFPELGTWCPRCQVEGY